MIKRFVQKTILANEIQNKLINSAFWAISGNIVIKGLSLVASLFIANFLGSNIFGELSMVKSTLSVFGLIASFGLEFTATKLIAESIQKNKEKVGEIISAISLVNFVFALLSCLILICFSFLISVYIFENEHLAVSLRIGGIFLFFYILNRYQLGVVAGLQLFKAMTKVNVVIGIISFPVLLFFTYSLGLNGSLLSLLINMAVSWLLTHILINKELNRLGILISYKKLVSSKIIATLRFSLPLAIKEMIYSLGVWFTHYLLLIKTDFIEVGIFNSANQLSQIALFIPGAISSVVLSVLSEQKNTPKVYSSSVKKSIKLNFLVTCLAASIIFLFSDIIYTVYGTSYEGGEYVLYVLLFAVIPMAITDVLDRVCISKSRPDLVSFFSLFRQVTIILSSFLFFYFYEKAISLAFSYLAGYNFSLVVMLIYSKNKNWW